MASCANHPELVVIYVDCRERLNIFTRIARVLIGQSIECQFIVEKLSLHHFLRNEGFVSQIALCSRKALEIYSEQVSKFRAERSIDVLTGLHNSHQAKRIFAEFYALLETSFNTRKVLFIQWNGASTTGLALSAYVAEKAHSCLYFELSNLGKRVFLDPQGVNAQSYLYEKPEILDLGEVSETERDKLYLSVMKEKQQPPPQAALTGRLNGWAIVDSFASKFGIGIARDLRYPWQRLSAKLEARKLTWKADSVELPHQRFVFVPLQVSSDTQIKLNSDIDNEGLIRHAHKVASDKGWKLYVKPHPAETDRCFISHINQLKAELGFKLVDVPTGDCLASAELVIVINSTVGLEAMLQGKKVMVLGKALYQHFAGYPDRLFHYINSYLIPIDYFGNELPDESVVGTILDRGAL